MALSPLFIGERLRRVLTLVINQLIQKRMNKILKTTSTFLLLSALVACGEDAAMEDVLVLGNGKTLESISIAGKDFQIEKGARSSIVVDNKGAQFLWAENDTVGIFPNTGFQAPFAMDEGAGTQSASFDGGGWALKTSSTYAAYYPFDFYNRDMTNIPVSYEKQAQTGNASTAHLGAYDFMAASVATPANGAVVFELHHMGCLVMLQTNLGEARKLTNVSFKCKSPLTANGFIDLTAISPQIEESTTTNALDIALTDFVVAENETTTIYFMMAPVNLLGETIEITLSDDCYACFKFQVKGKDFVAGKAYAYTLTEGEKGSLLPEYAVDLGLPSRTLWADRNVGASAPETCGFYCAWGETVGKSKYVWDTYSWYKSVTGLLSKYCTDSDYGTVDGKTILDLEDDAAYINMGSEWRMPTRTEMEELINLCTWNWTTQNGVDGMKVTGINGNSIFLPAGGFRQKYEYSWSGVYGHYWCSSLNEKEQGYAFELEFNSEKKLLEDIAARYYGCQGRAVVRQD